MIPMRDGETLSPVLELKDLQRAFKQGEREIRVLDGASAALMPGQAVALVGPSGAGKSTLLHIAGLLETPDGGHVYVNGQDCARMSDDERTRVRRAEMGFVYQFHQLLPEFSAIENVMMRSPCQPFLSGSTAMTSISISHSGLASAATTTPVETGNTPFSHLPTTR